MSETAQSVLIELPLEWMKSKIETEANWTARYFSTMVEAASSLGWRVETTPALMYADAAPRNPEEGQLCLSYHSYGDEPNVWRVKESYLPGYYTFDRFGYSGFSELAKYPERFLPAIQRFDLARAHAIIESCRARFLEANLSKYAQPDSVNDELPSSYIFFPLQTVHDAVQRFARLRQTDAIREMADRCAEYGRTLVIKRHPYCQDASTTTTLEAVTRASHVQLVDGPVRDLIAGATAVVGANSGVLFEALLAGKPVYSFASSDFALATRQLQNADDFDKVFKAPDGPEQDKERFIGWYLAEYCFEADDVRGMIRRLKKLALKNISSTTEETERLKVKKIHAETELARRDAVLMQGFVDTNSQNARNVVTLNMLRDAYNVAAYEKVTRWRRHAKRHLTFGSSADRALAKSLPRVKRDVLRQEYYEKMHAEEEGYKKNNWLLEYLPALQKLDAKHLVEIGCGNGKFLRQAASAFEKITGCDWVRTDTLPLEKPNVDFKQVDLTKGGVPQADIICSADVLEHMPVESIPQVLNSLISSAPLQFHVIACYDDGHSHLSVFDPATWLALFRRSLPHAWMYDVAPRFGDSSRAICVITNIPFDVIGDPMGNATLAEPEGATSKVPGPLPSPLRLDLGAAAQKTPGFLSVDVRKDSGAEIISDMIDLPSELKGQVDAIRCRHSLEHLARADARRALATWKSYLKPGGELNIIVPDIEFHARQYLGKQKSTFPDQYEHSMAGFYGWCDPERGGDDWDNHRWGYSFETLSALLAEFGYFDTRRVTQGADSEPWHLNIKCVA